MKNAPVTVTDILTATELLTMIRMAHELLIETGRSLMPDGFAQTLANFKARVANKAWREGYLAGHASGMASATKIVKIRPEYEEENRNPYPKLDP